MKIEIATTNDIPELMELHDRAFFAIAAEVNWLDAPGLKESLEQACEDFPKYMTLKMLSDEGKIVGSVRGRVEEGSLYIGRLMVLPECQGRGFGKILFREIQKRMPHDRAWLSPVAKSSARLRSTSAKVSAHSIRNILKMATRGFQWRRSKCSITA